PPAYLMRQPCLVGLSPLQSSSTPAFASSSWKVAIVAIMLSGGITPASESLLALTIIMNRMSVSPLVPWPSGPAVRAPYDTSNEPVRDRHERQKIAQSSKCLKSHALGAPRLAARTAAATIRQPALRRPGGTAWPS